MKIKSYKDLRIWQFGIEIVESIYKLTEAFPKEEVYVLTSQMRRASISIPSNIAEGFARQYNREYIQFLYIAFGSCIELETHLEIVKKLKYNTVDKINEISDKLNHLTRMIMSLIKKIKQILN